MTPARPPRDSRSYAYTLQRYLRFQYYISSTIPVCQLSCSHLSIIKNTISIYNYINKIAVTYTPSFHNFIKIVDALGVSADFLLQDYIMAVSDEAIHANPKDAIMAKMFSSLTEPQKDEVLHLVNFLNNEKD